MTGHDARKNVHTYATGLQPTKWKEGNTKPTARIMRLRRASYYGVQPTAWYKSHEDPTVMMRKLLQQWGWWENHFYQRLWNTAYSWLQRSQWSSDKVQWRWWGRHRASNYKVQAPERYILQQDTMRRMGSHRASNYEIQATVRYILQQDTMRKMGSHRASKYDVQLQLE